MGRSYPGVYPYARGGRTLYRCAWRTSDDKQRQKWGFESALAASKHRNRMVELADRGELVAGDGDTFAEFIAAWLAYRRPYLEPATYSDYEINVRLRLRPFFGPLKLAKIHKDDVRRYIAEQVESGLVGNKTINNSLGVLAAALADAVEDGLIAKNPAQGRKGARGRGMKLPVEKREMDFLRLYEIPAYLEAASAEYRPIAEVLVHAGPRVSEVCAMRVSWLDLGEEKGTIRVARSAKKDGEGSTKGDRTHPVEVGPRLVRMLRDHIAREAEYRDMGPDAYVFVRPAGRATAGTPYDRHRLYDLHKQTAQAIDRESLRPHDLRHTAAASWLACGLPLLYVQRQLGHAQYETTVEEYGHLEESFMQGAPVRVEKAIWERQLDPAGQA